MDERNEYVQIIQCGHLSQAQDSWLKQIRCTMSAHIRSVDATYIQLLICIPVWLMRRYMTTLDRVLLPMAQEHFGFRFALVQADNGPEYSHYFEDRLRRNEIPT